MPILLDTNVLVHAAYRGSPLFQAASQLVNRGLTERGVFCIAPQNLVEFVAVVTRERFVKPRMSPADLLRMVSVLYQSRTLAKIYPKRATVLRAAKTGAKLGLSGPRWYDLFLAETMRDSGIDELITEDAAHFRLFDFIDSRNITEAAGAT